MLVSIPFESNSDPMSFYLNTQDLNVSFLPVILERGIKYYQKGRVQQLSFEGDKNCSATVYGSTAYTVRIQLLENGVAKADCTCPYAEENACKHIAAVLLAIENESGDWTEVEIVEDEKPPQTDKDDFTVLLESATKKELIECIKKSAVFNPEIEQHITTIMSTKTGGLGKPGYRKIIKKALAPARRKGLMYGGEARRYLVPVYELLERTEELKASGSVQDVIEIAQVVMEEMVPALQFIDDSNADVGDSLRWATNLLFNMTEQPLDKERVPFFKWCLKSLDDKRYKGWDFEDDFLAMAVELAQTDKQIVKIQSLMDEKIRRLEKDEEDWSSKYHLQQTVLQKVRLLRKTGNEADADALLKKYQHLTDVYMGLIETAWQRDEFGRVKELAEAAIEKFEKQAPGLRKEWNEWLMKVAEKQGSLKEVLNLAQELLADAPSMERYLKVKNLVAVNEWDSYLREKLIPVFKQGFMGRYILSEIYVLENMWGELLAHMKQNPNLSSLSQFQHHFSSDGVMPAVDEIFGIYEQIIWEALAHRADRKNYRNVCRMLKKATSFGAIEQADKLVDDIREEYANRPSLLDELDNFGF